MNIFKSLEENILISLIFSTIFGIITTMFNSKTPFINGVLFFVFSTTIIFLIGELNKTKNKNKIVKYLIIIFLILILLLILL